MRSSWLVARWVECAGLAPTCGRAAGAAGTGLGDELVVVPLDVVDTKLADKLVHAAVDVVERIRIGQIEHLLSAALQRQSAGGGRKNPIGVVAGHVGIGVDHFRLEPQAEFHTLGVHVVGERLQGLRTIGPDVLRNLPVTEAGGVVAAGTEPTVIHHESFHAGVGGPVGERLQRIEVVVEVHGFPCVEDHRTAVREQARMQGARVGVEAGGDLIEAIAIGAEQPRGVVGVLAFAGAGERHFAAEQEFAAADHAGCVGQTFGGQHGVAAPAHVHRIGVAMLEAETGHAGGQEQGCVEVRAAGELRLFETADGQRLALRTAFT